MNNKQNGFEREVSKTQDTRKSYSRPELPVYGSVKPLTQSGEGSGADGGTMVGMTMVSDRLAKENIIRIGTHPLGIGFYLFDYRREYSDIWGHGRQFGVMADEVEKVMPEAASVHADGYKMVNYTLLGISHTLH